MHFSKSNNNFSNTVKKEDDDSSSSSSCEDEDACELTEDVEKKFFRALSCLKKKDPKIYDQDARFFDKTPELDENVLKEKKKKKTENLFTLRDYEKNLLVIGEGVSNNRGERNDFPFINGKKSYVQEQQELKQSFKKVLASDSEDEDDKIGGLFQEHSKSKSEKEKEDEDYREWLKGQRHELDDKKAEVDMKYLHDYWNDPSLDENEKFLRDYILNKRFLDKDENDEEIQDNFVSLEEDEKILNNQVEFEHKYNFRFEEPDQEFIKRYPRIMENSMRKKDNKRKLKREAVKMRKIEEKEQKIKELRKLQSLKRKEIEDKIKKIKEATGNEELGFQDEEIEKDFDPNEHDKLMQKLFSNEFYDQEESEQPIFNEDLDLEQYKDEEDYNYEENYDGSYGNEEPNYEGDDFNMDCDYTPEKAALAKQKKLEAREKKKNRKKMVSARESIMLNQNTERPVFDRNLHKTYQNYLDEYYSLDCEDFIYDMPCRFKYRKVEPNSFGLTIEEILAADDKELNKWCSLNKIYQIKPAEVEKYEVKAYKHKAKNEELKRKIFPSLYKSDDHDNDVENGDSSEKKKKKKKRKKKTKVSNLLQEIQSEECKVENQNHECETQSNENLLKRKHDCLLNNNGNEERVIENDNGCESSNFQTNKKHKKIHEIENDNNNSTIEGNLEGDKVISSNFNNGIGKLGNGMNNGKNKKNPSQKKQKNIKNSVYKMSFSVNKANKIKRKENDRFKTNKLKQNNDIESFSQGLSDTRLKAYGIKPKKFKNKLKYGNNK